MKPLLQPLALALATVVLPVPPAWAEIPIRPIVFAQGTRSATVQGALSGDATIDHPVRARAGQTLSVTLASRSTAVYFNVLPPGSRDEALFVGSRDGEHFAAVLPADGDYTIRVYLMRSAARRGERAAYVLTVGLAGAARPSDATVAGTPFHATGQVGCTLGTAQAPCTFGVVRQGPGRAQVHVRAPGGLERVLVFDGAQVTVGGANARVRATKRGDTWEVEVDDSEHYRIPDAVVNGG